MRQRKWLVFCILFGLGLAGCGVVGDLYKDYPRQVAALQTSLALAEDVGTAYVSRPVCGTPKVVLCRDPVVTKRLKELKDKAQLAVDTARKAEDETTLEAAVEAVTTLQILTTGVAP